MVVPCHQHDHHRGVKYFSKEANPAEETLSVLIDSIETDISCGPNGEAEQLLFFTLDSKVAGFGRSGTSFSLQAQVS